MNGYDQTLSELTFAELNQVYKTSAQTILRDSGSIG